MRYTLLEMTQLMLSAMDSDEVNSISDTVESYQVALLLKSVYYDIAVDLNLPEHETLIELDASGDSTKPTLMTVPADVTRIDWIKYENKATADTYAHYLETTFMGLEEFIEMQQGLRLETTNVGEMSLAQDDTTWEIMYKSNKMPEYYTYIGDKTLVFDSYDSSEDTTLQKAKTMCFGVQYPTFTLSDTFATDLDPEQFSYFINRAKVRAFAELKQTANQEAAAETRRQKIIGMKRKRRLPHLPEVLKVDSRFGRK